MSLEPAPPSEAVPTAPAPAEPPAPPAPAGGAPAAPAPAEPPAPPAPAGGAPAATAAAARPGEPRKSRPRRFWDAAKTIALIVSMFIDLILIVAVVILANQVGAIKLTLNAVLGQLDAAFEDLGRVVITETIKINQQVPVRFDLPLKQDTVVTTQSPVPISTQATFSLGQFGSINGTVSLQLPPGTSLPVHLELTVPVSNVIPVVFDQPVRIPLAEKGLGSVVTKLRAALAPIIGVVQQLPDRFVIVPQ